MVRICKVDMAGAPQGCMRFAQTEDGRLWAEASVETLTLAMIDGSEVMVLRGRFYVDLDFVTIATLRPEVAEEARRIRQRILAEAWFDNPDLVEPEEHLTRG